ncbi:RNA polymerase sigma factor [Bacteroides faecium]|uniref:RNA polymerase sigma-70 factor n=1 Tax=Bacteroides faecium TaxID=2715212 RepID=A0A6H0KIN4_9BACE|nr:RNA polymerase sigma-70 factor [Bacteroides faecium]QIU93230.1 RNA polymerase sigma-70 factor [Bacteroides faecium]
MKLESNDIDRIMNGDEAAFCRFMECHSSRLYHYVYALIGQKEPAEEVVSDVFYEVWKNRSGLAEIENMNAWIQTITYRKAISYLRKETGKAEVLLDDIGDFIFAPIQSPDEEMISKEEMEKINDAIQKLPPKCKHVFFLAKIEGLPYKEIANLLDISVKTINNHIAFALEKIAENLNIRSRRL